MAHRLVWNFEFTDTKNEGLSNLPVFNEEELKWEARFFWPEKEVINLILLDNRLLELSQYQHKQKMDHYFVMPKKDYNIKFRRGELLYKPIIKHSKYAFGFGSKIKLIDLPDKDLAGLEAQTIVAPTRSQVKNKSIAIEVKKESFTYKFSFYPSIKLELSKIEVNQKIYFSANIEGRSCALVETISKRLLGKKRVCNYVNFLKKIIKK